MGLVFTETSRQSAGSEIKLEGTLAFDSSYPTGGEAFTPAQFGFSRINRFILQSEAGYDFETDYTNSKIKALSGASGTTSATSGGTPAAQTFTGSVSPLNLAAPVFSGTGLTAAGQAMTTTSTHTMTLNQCAGMWLIAATGATPPMLILSNTAVAGAAAVLTVQGAAGTDAGAYKIVSTLPVGTNGASAALGTHTHTLAAAAGGEVANATNLSALSAVEVEIYGY